MKKFLSIFLVLYLVLFLITGCVNKTTAGSGSNSSSSTNNAANNKSKTEVVLKVGASPVPHAEILAFVKPMLEKQGIKLEIQEMTDYVTPNEAVYDKQLDANFFQHKPYLDEFNKEKGTNLVAVTKVHIEPMGLYSTKIKKISQLRDGATIAIPNDPTNSGRALLLLQKYNIIKLRKGAPLTATQKDIVDNPKHIKFQELDAAQLPRVLQDVDGAIINGNYALDAKLNPLKDALIIEDKDSPYANILVTRPDNKDNPAIKALAKALNSPEVKKFIEDKYKGAIVPAF
ncbi:D-methionine transport system substrate-binding protein [Caldanaerobius fijiensis DSM 17918]|uniref:Lipoprotein n=1 Tax=Caldanaerobius fijiensis DSM 17918 TaxID=1121256 RepID=A0A1M5A8D8_9THEO|nr:MetQ/NlpA family ABC transporter substrate-binding protein [Caldanaerobius fijiensis]SHF26415.1 D-methionine transport system substrate-binding protein [Caldanaerobius fijiensis DSM 17918]